MTVITRTVEIPKGSMRIRIGQSNNCSIGLIAVGFPVTTKTIDVTCPQIDSNMLNRKRLLRRILFGSVNKNAKYGIETIYHEFIHIIYENLDSRDKYIDLKFFDENGDLFTSSNKVTIVLSIKQ